MAHNKEMTNMTGMTETCNNSTSKRLITISRGSTIGSPGPLEYDEMATVKPDPKGHKICNSAF